MEDSESILHYLVACDFTQNCWRVAGLAMIPVDEGSFGVCKSKSLSRALGNIIGEYIDVHEDSLDEGWGPFLRIRVKLLVTKPLPRRQMISLPRIKDEFWIDFRYERLPEFCFECGQLGHPFKKCIAFMERMDSGNDDDFLYGPWMKGAKLPSNGYDRYRQDFAKGNAWPFLTRLARTTFSATIPKLVTQPLPQPCSLTVGETSNLHLSGPTSTMHRPPLDDRATTPHLTFQPPNHSPNSSSSLPTGIHRNNLPRTPTDHSVLPHASHQPCPTSPSPCNQLATSNNQKLLSASSHSNAKLKQPIFSNTLHLSHIFTPDIRQTFQHHIPIATYPPSPSLPIPNPYVSTIPSLNNPLFTTSSSPTISHNLPIPDNKENFNPNKLSKRPSDQISMRKFLKRCRNHNGGLAAPSLSQGDCSNLNVSTLMMDSDDSSDDPAEILEAGSSSAVSPGSFLMETRLGSNSINRFRQSLNFSHGLESPRVGLSGGLMLLWKDNINVSLNIFGSTYFDCCLSVDDGPLFHLTAFYGAPATSSRALSWTLLTRLHDIAPTLPWILVGDFNEILSQSDKSGGSLRNEAQLTAFRSTLDHCLLKKLPYSGDRFTWIKNRNTLTTIKERLDWVFTNHSWDSFFECPAVTHLDFFSSDHRAISAIVTPLNSAASSTQRRPRFRFEKLWLADLETSVTALNNVHSHSPESAAFLKQSESVLDDLLEQEEMYWQQRSRVDWLQLGDRNTKFFHSKASARKANNKIKFLQTESGARVTSKHDMAEAIQDYFANIFHSQTVDEDALQATLNCIPATITPEMNMNLIKPFTPSEVKDALFSMGSDKSPGIDGMSAMFYQRHWDIVGDSVVSAVLNVLNHGVDPSPLNSTIITLIPKKKKPMFVKDYRPIALCNVISKLITKVLVARFKPILPLVISENQSAFLPNRLITDNILVAFELIHGIKIRTAGCKGVAAMKLDMSKAFDRVEWIFVKGVMERMGFCSEWVTLIMTCLTTNHFTILLNGETTGSLTRDLIWSEIAFIWSAMEDRRGKEYSLWDGSMDTCELLNQYFIPADVERILTIPLSYFPSNDRLIWQHSNNGSYIVQSGYHLATSLAEQSHSSSSTSDSAWWKSFWSLQLPKKIKIFAWRVIHDALPVATSLVKRKIITDATCSVCRQAWESIGHIFFGCPMLKLYGVLHNTLLTGIRQFQCIKVVHSKKAKSATSLAAFSLQYLDHYRAAQHKYRPTAIISQQSSSSAPDRTPWQPPPTGSFKLNIDDALDKNSSKFGVGAVIRDSLKYVIAAFSMPLVGHFASHEMEAKAMFHGLNWALQQQLQVKNSGHFSFS
uniref:CCHC-type domain-containing protein n=1 Tax=Cannabis sativa TaxID=3483 RepID=A0A803NUC0_CANSA